MESADLKWIKRHYGEKFSHLCRDMFSTILEEEGMLPKLLIEHFSPNQELYDDILKNDIEDSFVEYVHSLAETEKKENKDSMSLCIPNYIQARDGKFYKYNQKHNNIYYCPNNIIIQNGLVIRFDKDKCIVFDYFILDLKGKEIIDYNLIQGNHQPNSFPESVGKINDIKRVPNENGLTIQITPKNGEIVEIELDKHNQITGYRNPNVEEIGDFFLFTNKSLKNLDLPNVKQIGGECLFFNSLLTGLNLPNVYVEFFGENFLQCNKSLTKLNLPNVEQIGDNFLYCNESLTSLKLPNVEQIKDTANSLEREI